MDQQTRAAIDTLHSRVNEAMTRLTVVETNYTHINVRLGKIEGGVSKLMWIVIGAVVLAAVAFVLKGGLTLPVPA